MAKGHQSNVAWKVQLEMIFLVETCRFGNESGTSDLSASLLHLRYPLVMTNTSVKNIEKSPCLMEKSTISMVIFNSYAKLPEGIKDMEMR